MFCELQCFFFGLWSPFCLVLSSHRLNYYYFYLSMLTYKKTKSTGNHTTYIMSIFFNIDIFIFDEAKTKGEIAVMEFRQIQNISDNFLEKNPRFFRKAILTIYFCISVCTWSWKIVSSSRWLPPSAHAANTSSLIKMAAVIFAVNYVKNIQAMVNGGRRDLNVCVCASKDKKYTILRPVSWAR